MGVNYYKQIYKVREYLTKKGFKQADPVPITVFGTGLMVVFGMKKETAIKWIQEFKDGKVIRVSKGMVYFLGGDGS